MTSSSGVPDEPQRQPYLLMYPTEWGSWIVRAEGRSAGEVMQPVYRAMERAPALPMGVGPDGRIGFAPPVAPRHRVVVDLDALVSEPNALTYALATDPALLAIFEHGRATGHAEYERAARLRERDGGRR